MRDALRARSVVLLGLILTAGMGHWVPGALAEELPRLPDPLVSNSGARVEGRSDWPARRAELRELLLHHEYGPVPPAPQAVRAEPLETTTPFEGTARLEHFRLSWDGAAGFSMECGLWIPNTPGPHPLVVAIDPVWQEHVHATARQVLARGYAFAGLKYHDVDPDKGDRSTGIYPYYPQASWGSIAAWAWSASRLIDYLATRPEIEPTQIAITGHSRCGKAAILAGALDARIALVAPHCSGAGGAALYRVHNANCETLEMITQPKRFYYWFVAGFSAWGGREAELPFDQHFLHALIAPRAFLSEEAQGDRWANPHGAWAACRAALPVYRLHGAVDRLAFALRPGGHAPIADDWETLLDFADAQFRGKPLDAAKIVVGERLEQPPADLPPEDAKGQ